MGTLSHSEKINRLKTVPLVNNHDTWRGWCWDSSPGSDQHADRDGELLQSGEERVRPAIDPDNGRADVAYGSTTTVVRRQMK